jgi:hypothetical protein
MVVNRNVVKILGFFIVIAFSIFSLLSFVSAGTDSSISEAANLKFTFLNQEPDPVSPGETLELRFKVENRGTENAPDVEVEFVSGNYFSIDSSERTKDIGTISGRQRGRDAANIKFKVKVDEKAGEGRTEVNLRFKSGNQFWTVVGPFNVSVGQRTLPLSIKSVSTEPKVLVPGNEGKIKFEVENLGNGDAINIGLKLNFTDSTPIVSYGTTNEIRIPRIAAKDSIITEINVITNPDSASFIYNVPLIMTYSDENGRNYTIGSQSFGVSIGSEPELKAALLDSDVLKKNKKVEITVEIINKGLSDVKFMTATLEKSNNYEILSPAEIYVGELDSTDSETISYTLFFNDAGPIMINLDYLDALNNAYADELEVPVRIYTGGEARKFGLESRDNKGIIITIIIVIAGVLVYRRFRKKKKSK